MDKQKYALIFKILLWVLIVLSAGVLIWGWVKGYPDTVAADNGTVDPLLYWAYIIIGIALCAVIVVGLIISAVTNPKSLIKTGLIVVGAAVLALIAYLLASGAPAMGLNIATPPTDTELKMTDTILNLAYIVGGAAIVSIIFGEVLMLFRKK